MKLIGKFPEDFDAKSEAQLDNEVYNYTGKDFDINNEIKNDQAPAKSTIKETKKVDQKSTIHA